MPQLTCDKCIRPAVFMVYSAYTPKGGEEAEHPNVKRYPMPMVRSCGQHLATQMWDVANTQTKSKLVPNLTPNPTEFYVVIRDIEEGKL